jgi:hypothetical protein
MSTHTDSLLSRFRKPEYTGENRCTPCTVVNVVIAVVFSAVLGIVSPVLAPLALGPSLAAIYLRGYLVPGTPQLTKRYFPDRVLRWFDKTPSQIDATLLGAADEVEEIDPEPILRHAGVLELMPDGADLRLTEEFQSEWDEYVEFVRGSDYDSKLAQMLRTEEDVDSNAVEVRNDDQSVTVFQDDTPIAMWASEAALIADVAAAPLLRERLPEWESMDLGVRGQLLYGVRIFRERCPSCDGDLALSEGTVESCCRSAEVVELTCTSCDARLLEVET